MLSEQEAVQLGTALIRNARGSNVGAFVMLSDLLPMLSTFTEGNARWLQKADRSYNFEVPGEQAPTK